MALMRSEDVNAAGCRGRWAWQCARLVRRARRKTMRARARDGILGPAAGRQSLNGDCGPLARSDVCYLRDPWPAAGIRVDPGET